MPRGSIDIYGARELRQKMRQMGVEGQKEALKDAHENVADLVRGRSQHRGTRQQVRAAQAMIADGTTTMARIRIKNTPTVPFAIGAFMGGKGRFGWYGKRRYRESLDRQFAPWVGNNWNLEAGIGPYVIADVVQENRDDIVQAFIDEMKAAALRLGLDWE